MKRHLAFLLSVFSALFVAAGVLPTGSSAQEAAPFRRVAYRLTIPAPASHLFNVAIDVETGIGQPPWVDFQMPRWQPGRYSVANFASNVQEFSARSDGRALTAEKIDDQT